MPSDWKGRRRRVLEPLARRAGNTVLGGRGVLTNRFLAGKLLPLAPDSAHHSLLTRSVPGDVYEGLPVPPEELWKRWGRTVESYFRGGRIDAERIVADLEAAGAEHGSIERVLDFGCAEGRVLRFFPDRDHRDLWGVDVNAERIAWCQQNLTPPFRFATTTTAPHVPFADGSFDLVYALSVFTHISELADAWFLELLRVLRPGGHLYLTIHDEHTIQLLLDDNADRSTTGELADLVRRFDRETGALSSEWVYFAVHADPGAQVFHRTEELVRRWSLVADIRTVNRAAVGYQTALLFRRPESQRRRAGPT